VHLVGIYPSNGCGVGREPDCTVPVNATITLRFDRFLNPATVNRQAIQVYTGDPMVASTIPFDVDYDPIERVVEYRMPSGYRFAKNALYQLVLVQPEGEDVFGIRAFDGAPLREDELPLHGSFFTSDQEAEVPAEEAPPGCRDIVDQVFKRLGSCAGSECHNHEANAVLGSKGRDLLGGAPHGLWLDSPGAVRVSAIGRVARQTETGDESGGISELSGPRFGVRMALIEPKNPGSSYLLYKLLRKPDNYEPCEGREPEICRDAAGTDETSHVLLPFERGQSVIPSPEELDRLREWFVRGSPMPLADSQQAVGSVSLQGLRALSRFIAAGADCPD
jgi:hypothetical protein